MKNPKIVAALAAASLLALALTGCTQFPLPEPKVTETSKAAEPEPVEEVEVPEPEPVDALGTYANPGPVGSGVVVEEFSGAKYEVTPTVTEWDGNATIGATNQFNSAPTAGTQYLLATILVTNTGDSLPVDPTSVAWSISFLGSDGIARTNSSVVTPVEYFNVGEVYPGASASFNLAFEVPVGSTTGTWVFEGTPPYYVAAS